MNFQYSGLGCGTQTDRCQKRPPRHCQRILPNCHLKDMKKKNFVFAWAKMFESKRQSTAYK